jgi:maltose alpha-D-glucosyltransferase/alpha-amylase
MNPEEIPFLEPWVKVWYHYISTIYLQSYLETVKDAPFLPEKEEDFDTLLNAFLLQKAVYELGYELNNRPDWVMIPVRGIRYILKET